MNTTDHPFQPGVIVAVKIPGARFSYTPPSWREDEVLKVHKNGNFTLKSDPKQQWRGHAASRWGMEDRIASANSTGSHHGTLHLLSDVKDIVAKDNEAHARWERWKKIEFAIERLPYERVTDRSMSLFEEAIRELKPKQEKPQP